MIALRHRLGGYEEYAAPLALAPFAESVWRYQAPQVDPGAVHRVLPDPALNLVFACRRRADGRLDDARLGLLGPKTRPELSHFLPGCELVAAKIKLEWMAPLLGLPMAECHDQVIELSVIDPRLASVLTAALFETRSIDTAMAALTCTLSRYVKYRRSPSVAASALDLVRRAHGNVSVECVAHCVAVSPRYLRRLVERDAGVTLKSYARTIRLLRVVTLADAYPPTAPLAWAALAADAGYFDQSHFIRDCQALCGLPPGEILRERRAQMVDRTGT